MEELDLDLGFDVDFDALVPFDSLDFSKRDADFALTESLEDVAASADDITDNSEVQADKRYLSKRPHRKSRAGCKQCKKRKVKVHLLFSTSLRRPP
jgi:hypothetical protein